MDRFIWILPQRDTPKHHYRCLLTDAGATLNKQSICSRLILVCSRSAAENFSKAVSQLKATRRFMGLF
jgi:hypothetical protein